MRKRLVLVTIVGILVAVAISEFAVYRQQKIDVQAKSELHDAAACRALLRLVSGQKSSPLLSPQ